MTSYTTRLRECHRMLCFTAARILSNRPHDISDEDFITAMKMASCAGMPTKLLAERARIPLIHLELWSGGINIPKLEDRSGIFDNIAEALRDFAKNLE